MSATVLHAELIFSAALLPIFWRYKEVWARGFAATGTRNRSQPRAQCGEGGKIQVSSSRFGTRNLTAMPPENRNRCANCGCTCRQSRISSLFSAFQPVFGRHSFFRFVERWSGPRQRFGNAPFRNSPCLILRVLGINWPICRHASRAR